MGNPKKRHDLALLTSINSHGGNRLEVAIAKKRWDIDRMGPRCVPMPIYRVYRNLFDWPNLLLARLSYAKFAGTFRYDRSRLETEAQPSNFRVRSISVRKISRARATPASPAAASPYA